MPSVLLAGAFGQRNPGDEALLSAFRAALADRRIVAASADPAATLAEHGVEAIDSRDWRAVARAIIDADAIVFAGGTVFKTLQPSTGRAPLALLRNAVAVAIAARALRRPLALVGVGAAELPRGLSRRLARALVKRAGLLVLRDEDSASLLAEVGAPAPFRVGADPAWTLVSPPVGPTASGDAVIVALSHVAGGPRLAAELAAALATVADAGLRVRLQPWRIDGGGGDDLALAREVAAALGAPVDVLPPPLDLEDARELFEGARVVLGLRFHALVAAAAAGVPFVAVAHEPKLRGVARRLGQRSVPSVSPPRALAAAVLEAAGDNAAGADAVGREIAAAEESLLLLRVLLSGGRGEEHARLDGLELRPREWVL